MLLRRTGWVESWLRALSLAGALAIAAGASIAQRSQVPSTASQSVTTQPAQSVFAGVRDIDAASIRLREGQSYIVNLPELEAEADSGAAPRRSLWTLLEDNLPLGPGHCLHADIASNGAGRYSHWQAALIFSSSDGTDPRTNGRRYTFVKSMDHEGHRIHFPGSGAILILQVSERLWWPDPEALETFAPRFGPRRLEVNPSLPQRDGATLVFNDPGEFGLRSPHQSVRVLVLHRDQQQWARQIVGFVAASTTGGRADEPERLDGVIDWPTVSRAHFHHLFSTEDSLDVACGQSARLVCVLAESVGLSSRYCGWIGSDEPYSGHVGVEIFNTARQAWEYYDPHFGLSARDRTSALNLAVSLRDTYAGRESDAFIVLVDKTDSDRLTRQWASFKSALQMWPDASRRTSIVLLLRDAIPSTLDPDEFNETEFLSASTDLATFRERFYESAAVGAQDKEPAR